MLIQQTQTITLIAYDNTLTMNFSLYIALIILFFVFPIAGLLVVSIMDLKIIPPNLSFMQFFISYVGLIVLSGIIGTFIDIQYLYLPYQN